jgi:hypothetical protein
MARIILAMVWMKKPPNAASRIRKITGFIEFLPGVGDPHRRDGLRHSTHIPMPSRPSRRTALRRSLALGGPRARLAYFRSWCETYFATPGVKFLAHA